MVQNRDDFTLYGCKEAGVHFFVCMGLARCHACEGKREGKEEERGKEGGKEKKRKKYNRKKPKQNKNTKKATSNADLGDSLKIGSVS